MKKKLLLLLFFVTLFSFSQTINNFDSTPMSMFAVIDNSTSTVDQSPEGENVTWNFTLNTTGSTSTDTYEVITNGSPVEMTYGGTTSALTTTLSTSDVSKVFTKNMSNTVSITGVEGEGLVLNYSSDNALIGTFPLNYNDTNGGDTVSGTFSFDGNSGTFTGTVLSTVEAYGALTMSDVGSGVYNGNVTRLKIEQDIILTIGFLSGTLEQTSYYYYDVINGNLVFRNTEAVVTTPLGTENISVMESLLSSTLGTNENEFTDIKLSIFPNPVNDNLNFKQTTNSIIESVSIFDMSGREVLHTNSENNDLSVSHLNSGIYLLSIITNKGIESKKFIKK